MSDALRTAFVLGMIFVIAIIAYMTIIVIIEIRKARRIRINEDLADENKRLRFENGQLRGQLLICSSENRVHKKTIDLRDQRISQLERENEELKAGTPVCTGFLFVK